MCLRHYRHCRVCNTVYNLLTDANQCKFPFVLFDVVCTESSCQRLYNHYFNPTLGLSICGSPNCSIATCRVEMIYLECEQQKSSDWKYILKSYFEFIFKLLISIKSGVRIK